MAVAARRRFAPASRGTGIALRGQRVGPAAASTQLSGGPVPPSSEPAMTNVFAVVGEHRDEPTRLLLIGDDGRYYAYATDAATPTEVEPTAEWAIDAGADPQGDAELAFAP